MKYPFVRPEIPEVSQWGPLLESAYRQRYFTNFGELETRLSQNLEEQFGTDRSAVTLVANATCGLTAALIAHGVEGNVVVPNFTFPATLDAVLSARCTPVVCDVDPITGEMSVESLETACRSCEVAAVMPVRTYGFVRDFAPLIAVARSVEAVVIIDAAASLGAATVEADQDVTEVVSLHATKSFGIGEGGAIFSHRSLKAAMRQAINFGLQEDRRFDFGINGKMSEFHAAVGLAQLRQVGVLLKGRKAMAEWYNGLLAPYPGLELPCLSATTAWSNYPVWLPAGTSAQEFQNACHERGLQVRRYYWPTLKDGFTGKLESFGSLDVSADLASRAVCLPLYPSTNPDERTEIASILRSCLSESGVRASAVEPVSQ